MIDSTSSSTGASGANALTPGLSKFTVQRSNATGDRLSSSGADQLRELIAAEPEVRPEMVARGRALAADPGYPPSQVIDHLAALLVNSPDLANETD